MIRSAVRRRHRMLPTPRILPVLALLLSLSGERARAQSPVLDLSGTWTGGAILTNDWPGFPCRYEGPEEPPAVRLELSREGARWRGSVAVDAEPAPGSGCPPLKKRYSIAAAHVGDASVSFTDSGGNEWNLAVRREEAELMGLLAWKTGDESLAAGFKAPSGATPLARLSGEVKLRRAAVDAEAPAAAGGAAPREKVTAGKRVGHLAAVLAANAVAAGALYGVNKAGRSGGEGGAVTCSPRNCIIAALGEPCLCNANVISGAPCGTTAAGVPQGGVCDGTMLPCQSGFSCNRGFCEDRAGACPF
ncbi:MAG TPA: hypothetical protein VLI67_10430 [Vicinamibacteria bacterium]|nr:hypothetical protein [Vicinamibacteria bacterium]